MAASLLEDGAPNRVPIFISAQELARMMRENQETKGNLIQKYIINSSHGGRNGVQEMARYTEKGLHLAPAAAVRRAAYNFSAPTFFSLERLGWASEEVGADWYGD